jgi:hypothetical protein
MCTCVACHRVNARGEQNFACAARSCASLPPPTCASLPPRPAAALLRCKCSGCARLLAHRCNYRAAGCEFSRLPASKATASFASYRQIARELLSNRCFPPDLRHLVSGAMIRGRGGLRRIGSPLQRAVIVHKQVSSSSQNQKKKKQLSTFLVHHLDAVTHLADAELLQLRMAQQREGLASDTLGCHLPLHLIPKPEFLQPRL